MTIYQALAIWIALLLAKNNNIFKKYLDFANVFLKKLAKVSSDIIEINKHTIKFQKNK